MLMDNYGGKPNVVITVAPELPKWIWLDGFLFHLIISNAFSNAVVHGETNGKVKIHVSVSEERQINVSMSNNPGMKHAENCKLQEEFGFNHLLKGGKDNAQLVNVIGSEDSTFLGCAEMRLVADIMETAEPALYFGEEVTFSLSLPLHEAQEPEKHILPEGEPTPRYAAALRHWR